VNSPEVEGSVSCAVVHGSTVQGSVIAPPSKSHTIRAFVLASLADGESIIRNPLLDGDGASALKACQALGAIVDGPVAASVSGSRAAERAGTIIRLKGTNSALVDGNVSIDVGNSGTTLTLVSGIAALRRGITRFDGDASIRRRPVKSLLDALFALGASTSCNPGGVCPCTVAGTLRGGMTTVDGSNSQFTSSLLIASALGRGDAIILPEHLREQPYVRMTLAWMRELGAVVHDDFPIRFHVPGGQRYQAFDKTVPGDWSSAAFALCAGALTGTVTVTGLYPDDAQGDKAILDVLRQMGSRVDWARQDTGGKDGTEGGCRNVTVSKTALRGVCVNLSDTPDLLPILAVVATQAEGETILYGCAHARSKETDRIAVMAKELALLGADIEATADGLRVRRSQLRGAMVHSHADHRVAMALSVAGLVAADETIIADVGCASITYPGFYRMLERIGAKVSVTQERVSR